MRPNKPIKIKRTTDRTRWMIPLLGIALTASVSLVIALAWQNLTVADAMAPQDDFIWPSAPALPSGDAPSTVHASAQAPEEAPIEERPESPEDFYGSIFPERGRVSSDYFSNAVFVGDSLTTGFKLYDVMSDTTVLAATGINLNSVGTSRVIETESGGQITILDALALGEYEKVYVMMGANGISFLSNDHTVKLYGEFIDEVKARCPNSLIYIQSILPINEAKFRTRYEGNMSNEDIDYINGELQKLAAEKGCFYLDVASAFKDEVGQMPEAATPDGIHIYSAGYTTWFDYLKTHAYQAESIEAKEVES